MGIWSSVPALFPALHTAPPPRLLDLAHGGPSAADSTAHVDARGASAHDGEDHGGDPSGPTKPEEGGRGLGLAAALLRVVAAVGDMVCEGVSLRLGVSLHVAMRRVVNGTLLLQLCTCRYAGVATAAQNQKMTLSVSRAMLAMGML